ncbi:MAG: ABC transporter ATP-binding protein [Patescibacteria group bacterium]|jgi:putative ABC transport system ATP-binding protein
MLELKNITKSYFNGDVETQVLKGVSFRINDGEFVAIIGPSGSGKSTIMNIIGCLDSPSSGEYFIDNNDIAKLSDDELAIVRRQRIGFVFQSFNLLPRATVMRNVVLPLVYGEVPLKDRQGLAEKALASAGLDKEHWYHLSNQLSGGQMQRVAIARALVDNPSIILADEPTGNLDSKTGKIVLETFKRLNREEKRTIVLITHDMEVAKNADRIISIKDGLLMN